MWSCSQNPHTPQHCPVNLPLPKLDALRKMGFTAVSQMMPHYWNAAFTACCQIFNKLFAMYRTAHVNAAFTSWQPALLCSQARGMTHQGCPSAHPHDKDTHHPRAQVTLTSQRSQCWPVTPVLQKHWPVCGWQESVPQGEQLHSAREKYTQYFTEEPVSHFQHSLLTENPISPLIYQSKLIQSLSPLGFASHNLFP